MSVSKKKDPTILVCIDSSNASLIALKYASIKAQKLGFRIEILSILEPSHKNLLFGSSAISKEKRGKMEEYIQKAVTDIFKDKDYIPSVEIREGDITNEILREVKNNTNCVTLVFGKSHSSSQSDNTVLPKMAQNISRKIRIPILIVPENIDKNIFDLML